MKIKLTILVLVGVAGAIASGRSQTNLPPPLGASIAFAALDFDFGKVDSGTVIQHDYVFTNTGDQVLEVTGVRPSCGCTPAGDWDKRIEPGKTGKIPVQFNTAGYGGPVQKTIFVTCNDTNQPNLTLKLQGTIWKLIDIKPAYAVFNLLPEGQDNQTLTVKIINNGDQPLSVTDPTCGNPAFQLVLQPVLEGKEYELKVTALASNIFGNISAPVTLKTSSENMPQISLSAFVMMPPVLSVTPPQIMLPAGLLTNATQFTVTIQNNGANPVVLTDPQVNSEGVEVQLAEQQPGRQFSLTVNFPAGFQTRSAIQATVKSNNPKHPSITIPVYQPAPPPVAAPPHQGGSAAAQPGPSAGSVASMK